MKTLLISTHAPSANTKKLRDAAVKGALEAQVDVVVQVKSAQNTQPEDVLAADALLIGTTENLAYMAGLTKDFFDRCYYPVLNKKQGLPVVLYIRAGHDGTATQKAFEPIFTGLKWRLVQSPLICQGAWQDSFTQQVYELGQGLAVGLDAGIF